MTNPEILLTLFLAAAREAAGRLWGYPGLIDDAGPEAAGAFLAGADPEEFAEELGEDLGLTVPDPWTMAALAKTHGREATEAWRARRRD